MRCYTLMECLLLSFITSCLIGGLLYVWGKEEGRQLGKQEQVYDESCFSAGGQVIRYYHNVPQQCVQYITVDGGIQ